MCILQHVNIVALFAMIFEFGHFGLVMEHVLLGTLDAFTYKYLVVCLFEYDFSHSRYVIACAQTATEHLNISGREVVQLKRLRPYK